jgi:hypothetical protein
VKRFYQCVTLLILVTAGDLGTMALAVRVVVALVPYDFLAGVFSFAAPYMGDYQKHNKNRGGKKE